MIADLVWVTRHRSFLYFIGMASPVSVFNRVVRLAITLMIPLLNIFVLNWVEHVSNEIRGISPPFWYLFSHTLNIAIIDTVSTKCYIEGMIDDEQEYKALQKLCRNEFYQFTTPVPKDIKKKWSKAPDVFMCPHWVFSEEYALSKKDFGMHWHTPGVMDGGIIFDAHIGTGNTLYTKTVRDGIVELGIIDHQEIDLERGRNRMISIQLSADVIYDVHSDGGTGKINISYFDDPAYILWTVQYFDYIANEEKFVVVRARTRNEAKVIAWANSCYKHNVLNPETFNAYKYTEPNVLTVDTERITKPVMEHYLTVCKMYDEKEGIEDDD